MTVTVGLRELNQRTSHVLDTVKEGVDLIVTEHSRPIARIIPYVPNSLELLQAQGRITPGTSTHIVRPKPISGRRTTRPSEELLDDIREDRV